MGSIPERVTEMRKAWAASDAARDKGLLEPGSVVAHKDISYGPHGTWNLLDVYLPKKTENAVLPVIMSIHGGGFFYGDKELYRFYTMHLAEMGFAVVNYNYRLAPEHHFPAPLEDAMAVLSWISANASNYRLDTSNVFLIGDSAGAQLVSQLACILTNPEYAKLFELKAPEDIKVRAISLSCGVYTLVPPEGEEFSPMMTDYLADEARRDNPRLEVMGNITAQYPPTFIFSAYNDSLYSVCEPMAEFLRSRGVEVRCEIYGSPEDMEVRHVFQVNMRLSEGERANRDQTGFFREHLQEPADGGELRLELQDTEWPRSEITHDRNIARAIVYDEEGYFYFVHVNRDDAFGKASVIETPGGGVEAGEELGTAIRRELSEELGADVDVQCKIGVVSDFYNVIGRHNLSNYFLCKVRSFGDRHLTKDEIEDFHLQTMRLTYEQALAEYEKNLEYPFGRLVAAREVPVLKRAKELIEKSC